LVTHDESTFNANDDDQYLCKVKGTEGLKPQGKGKGLMISEFLTEAQGRLHYWDKVSGTKIEAHEIFKSGKKDEGWWDSEEMLNQVLTKAVPIFERAFLGHSGVFAFDNSSGHTWKAPDALVVSRMNMGPGGKQPKMHPTITPQNFL